MEFHSIKMQSHWDLQQAKATGMELADCFMNISRLGAEQMKRSNLMVHYGDSDIVLSKHVSPYQEAALKAPFFRMRPRTGQPSWLEAICIESICENIPLKGKHNIIMQAARTQTDTLDSHMIIWPGIIIFNGESSFFVSMQSAGWMRVSFKRR